MLARVICIIRQDDGSIAYIVWRMKRQKNSAESGNFSGKW